MIRETSAIPYTPEKYLLDQGIRKVGVGLFIIDPQTSEVWFIEELKDKQGVNGTGRKKNTLSIPLETRKQGEKITDNIFGALAEFRQLNEDEELVWVDGESYLGRFLLVEGVAVDLVRVGINNKTENSISVIDSHEVKPVGWKTVDEICTEHLNIREGVFELLKLATVNGWITEFSKLMNQGNIRTRVLTHAINLEHNFRSRELGQDI